MILETKKIKSGTVSTFFPSVFCEEELKNFVRLKEESDRAGLKLHIQKTNIMAFCPITSWQIDRETMETVTNFIFLGSKITAYSG